MAPRAAIVIVNYNGAGFVAEAVRSALAQTERRAAPDRVPVIVVDNASTDASLAVLRAFADDIVLIASATNTGFSGGNNLAFARVPDAESYALLNPDAVADPDWLEQLLAAADRHAGWGFIASRIRDLNAPGRLDNVGLRLALDGTVRGLGRGEPDQMSATTPSALSSSRAAAPCCCAAATPRAPRAASTSASSGLLRRRRALPAPQPAGPLPGWFAPAAKAGHRFSSTTGAAFSPFKAYHVERNRYWVVAKCFPLARRARGARRERRPVPVVGARGRQPPATGPARRSWRAPAWAPLAGALARAHRDALLGLPHALRDRHAERGARKLGGVEFLSRWRRDYLPMHTAVHLE